MNLPDCHSRKRLDGHANAYFCMHPEVHVKSRRVTAAICRGCDYWRQPEPGMLVEHATYSPLDRIGRCDHLGAQTGERLCATCGGSVRIKLFTCHHPDHSETTIRDCLLCHDFEIEPAMTEDARQVN